MSEKAPIPSPLEPKSVREMFRELAKVFHPDKGGDKRLMQDLNAAYKLAQVGDNRRLKEIYFEWKSSVWIGGKGERKPVLTEKMRQTDDGLIKSKEELKKAKEEFKKRGVVYLRLLQENDRLYKEIVKNGLQVTNEERLYRKEYLRNFYKKLCEKEGMQPNEFDLMSMLYDKGYISEEEYKKFKGQFFRKK